MEILSKLFGSPARVKILRLFLFNEGDNFENSDIATRARVSVSAVRKEVSMMEKIGLIKRKVFYTQIIRGNGKKKKITKKKVSGWTLNPQFVYLHALRSFLLTATPMRENAISKRLQSVAKCKLILIAGVFIQDWNSRLDLLLVADGVQNARLETAIKEIEAELGKELRYAVFSTVDFTYRMNIYDKLIRDVLDYPHQTVLNKLGEWYSGGDSFSNAKKG
jgi:DNA-binding Lrp family transcriptional regulator